MNEKGNYFVIGIIFSPLSLFLIQAQQITNKKFQYLTNGWLPAVNILKYEKKNNGKKSIQRKREIVSY